MVSFSLYCYWLQGHSIFFRASVDDVIGTLLSLYMHDSSQSLPTAEEVLICTPDTTTEEVSCWLKLLQKARNVVF